MFLADCPRVPLPMKIDPAGLPFVAVSALLAAASVALQWWWPAAAFVLGALGFVFFFRDPERRAAAGPDDVIAPADGRVMVAGPASPETAPAGSWTQVSIFLSPLNVHVNRVPVGGTVTRAEYRPGRYLAAYRPEATAENERSEVWIDDGRRTVVCRQITGVLVRRVVCRVKAGDRVRAGDRLGVMKFGSRIDLFLPVGTRLRAAVGDSVRAGETVLAVLPAAAEANDQPATGR